MLATSSPASETGSSHRKYIVQSAGAVRQPRRSRPAYVCRRDSFLFRMAIYCCQVLKSQQQKAAASPPSQLTLLLNRMQRGDQDAAEQAASLVYAELHRIASRQMTRERPDHVLQTTALAHE